MRKYDHSNPENVLSTTPESPAPHHLDVGRQFLSWWILANAVGVGLGVVIGWVLAGVVLPVVFRAALWTGVGVVVGTTQHLVLRHQFNSTGWIWVTIAGWALGGTLAGREDVDWVILGGIVGAMQTLALKNYIQQAWWWVLANATGLGVGGFVGGSVILLEDFYTFKTQLIIITEHVNEVIGWVVSGSVGGAAGGLVTGLWLVWLLRSKRRI